MAAMSSADVEKFEKLKEKYNQLKQANAVLKKGLLEKQEECGQKEQAVKEKENAIRQQLEEIDHLQFQNGRMSKQMGTLTDQVESLQKQKPSSGLSIGGGFFSGKQQQEAIQNAENEIKVLRDELVTKIEENEDLHMQMYECKRSSEEDAQRLEEATASIQSDLEKKSSELENEREKVHQLSSDNKSMREKIRALEEDLEASKSLASSAEAKLEEERQEAKKQTESLQAQLARALPFDEAAHSPWNLWNCTSRHGREAQWRKDSMKQFQSSVVEACKQSAGVLEIWAKTFSMGGDGEPSKRLKMRLKMSETAQKLSAMIGETVPGLISTLGQSSVRVSSLWERHFKTCIKSMLQTHRQWVTYQSLLLLHDPDGVRSTRSLKETAQAQGFVDCLWRLHRCVGILFSKIRLVLCVSLLTTQCGSSMHFMQARELLRRGSGSSLQKSDRSNSGLSRRSGSGLPAVGNSRMGGYPDGDGSAITKSILGPGSGDASRSAVEQHLTKSSAELMERVRIAAKDVSQCWEGIARCLSSWATSQQVTSLTSQPDDSGGVVSLLESLHGLCACMGDRLLPSVDSLLADVPRSISAAVLDRRPSMWGLTSPVQAIISSMPSTKNGTSFSCMNRYTASSGSRLLAAPGSIGFDESSQTQVFVRQLAAEKARLSNEVKQQIKRLREVSQEKNLQADELRSLQDNHALLRSNLQVLKEQAVQRRDGDVTGLSQPDLLCTERPGSNELVLNSRQKALLESLTVTTQESSNLRQHGFFVDVISLTTGEASLAAGPPDMDAYDSWEMAVRKVYEQHAHNLQAQVRVADDKAKELYVRVQESMENLKEQEDSKQKLRDDVSTKQFQLANALEDVATTRKSYDGQLALLTEHICTLSANLSDKDANVAKLHTHKVLCGHCGMWNVMGKLLAKDSGGKCNTCKEKVLNPTS